VRGVKKVFEMEGGRKSDRIIRELERIYKGDEETFRQSSFGE